MDPGSNDSCPYEKRRRDTETKRRRHLPEDGARAGVTCLQARDTEDCQEPPEVGGAGKGDSSEPSEGVWSC